MPPLGEGEGDDEDGKTGVLALVDGKQVSKQEEPPARLSGEDNKTASLSTIAMFLLVANKAEAWGCTYAIHPLIGVMQI
jgi:hypothetical protein